MLYFSRKIYVILFAGNTATRYLFLRKSEKGDAYVLRYEKREVICSPQSSALSLTILRKKYI